jgi:hypothetical protein
MTAVWQNRKPSPGSRMPVKRLSERGKARKIDDLPVDLLKNKGNCGGVHNLFSK